MATFITSKSVGQTIGIYAETSTGYWKYNHNGSDSSANSNGWITNIPVTNSNGEFTIMSCDSDGTVNGDVTILYLGNRQITSFNGTGLSSLITLELNDNQLTSFDGTGLSSLTRLVLESNLLTSFDGNGLTSLTQLALQNNLITSFDGTGLSSLNSLYLGNNLLTIFDITGLSSLHVLYLNGNPMTPSANNQILQQLNQLSVSGGDFGSNNGRTSASNADYNNLVSLGWSFSGLDLVTPPVVGNGKLAIRGFIPTTTTTTTEAPTTTTTTTEAPTSTTMSSVSVSNSTGKNGETNFQYNIVLNQNKYMTASFIGGDIGQSINSSDLMFFAVDSNGSFILGNDGSPLNGANYTNDDLGANFIVRNDLFNGNLRVAICYFTNSSGYVVYEIYPTVFTVS